MGEGARSDDLHAIMIVDVLFRRSGAVVVGGVFYGPRTSVARHWRETLREQELQERVDANERDRKRRRGVK